MRSSRRPVAPPSVVEASTGAVVAMLELGEYAPSRSSPERKPWVARLLGHDPKANYEREFVDAQREYLGADKRGRGIKSWFRLSSGHLYEVCRWRSRDRSERYYVRVDADGEVQGVRQEDVDRILEESACMRDATIRRLLGELDGPLKSAVSASTS